MSKEDETANANLGVTAPGRETPYAPATKTVNKSIL